MKNEPRYGLIPQLEEFGRMLMTYAGWGMRIEFVPDDQLHRRPTHEVREPDPEDASEA